MDHDCTPVLDAIKRIRQEGTYVWLQHLYPHGGADGDRTRPQVLVDRLADALERLAADPPAPDRPSPAVPPLKQLNLEQAMSPRDAFFAETEQVRNPIGRISAEMTSPYPPGAPTILPGERFNEAVVSYLRAGEGSWHDDSRRVRPRPQDLPGRNRPQPHPASHQVTTRLLSGPGCGLAGTLVDRRCPASPRHASGPADFAH